MKFGKIIHLFVATVLLISTIGVVINKHYSGDELFSTALFVHAKSCCESSCCHSKPMKGCHEEVEYHKLDVDFTIPDKSASLNFVALDISLFLVNSKFTGNLFSEAIQNNIEFLDIRPPPKITDLTVLFHSLLI
jgi:hypothetical protein